MRSVAASGLLWAERIVLFIAGAISLAIAGVLIAWLLAVDWQVLTG